MCRWFDSAPGHQSSPYRHWKPCYQFGSWVFSCLYDVRADVRRFRESSPAPGERKPVTSFVKASSSTPLSRLASEATAVSVRMAGVAGSACAGGSISLVKISGITESEIGRGFVCADVWLGRFSRCNGLNVSRKNVRGCFVRFLTKQNAALPTLLPCKRPRLNNRLHAQRQHWIDTSVPAGPCSWL